MKIRVQKSYPIKNENIQSQRLALIRAYKKVTNQIKFKLDTITKPISYKNIIIF